MLLDPFCIPLLMFLSGMLLHKSLTKPDRDYIPPLLIWSLAVYGAERRLTLEYVLQTPINAQSELWYLWFLCAVLLRWRIPLVPVMLACLVASEFLPGMLRMDRFAALLICWAIT